MSSRKSMDDVNPDPPAGSSQSTSSGKAQEQEAGERSSGESIRTVLRRPLGEDTSDAERSIPSTLAAPRSTAGPISAGSAMVEGDSIEASCVRSSVLIPTRLKKSVEPDERAQKPMRHRSLSPTKRQVSEEIKPEKSPPKKRRHSQNLSAGAFESNFIAFPPHTRGNAARESTHVRTGSIASKWSDLESVRTAIWEEKESALPAEEQFEDDGMSTSPSGKIDRRLSSAMTAGADSLEKIGQKGNRSLARQQDAPFGVPENDGDQKDPFASSLPDFSAEAQHYGARGAPPTDISEMSPDPAGQDSDEVDPPPGMKLPPDNGSDRLRRGSLTVRPIAASLAALSPVERRKHRQPKVKSMVEEGEQAILEEGQREGVDVAAVSAAGTSHSAAATSMDRSSPTPLSRDFNRGWEPRYCTSPISLQVGGQENQMPSLLGSPNHGAVSLIREPQRGAAASQAEDKSPASESRRNKNQEKKSPSQSIIGLGNINKGIGKTIGAAKKIAMKVSGSDRSPGGSIEVGELVSVGQPQSLPTEKDESPISTPQTPPNQQEGFAQPRSPAQQLSPSDAGTPSPDKSLFAIWRAGRSPAQREHIADNIMPENGSRRERSHQEKSVLNDPRWNDDPRRTERKPGRPRFLDNPVVQYADPPSVGMARSERSSASPENSGRTQTQAVFGADWHKYPLPGVPTSGISLNQVRPTREKEESEPNEEDNKSNLNVRMVLRIESTPWIPAAWGFPPCSRDFDTWRPTKHLLTPESFRFMELPRSLRNQIYPYALGLSKPVTPFPLYAASCADLHLPEFSLLFVSTAVYREAKDILYTEAIFSFDLPANLLRFIDKLQDIRYARIRRIRIDLLPSLEDQRNWYFRHGFKDESCDLAVLNDFENHVVFFVRALERLPFSLRALTVAINTTSAAWTWLSSNLIAPDAFEHLDKFFCAVGSAPCNAVVRVLTNVDAKLRVRFLEAMAVGKNERMGLMPYAELGVPGWRSSQEPLVRLEEETNTVRRLVAAANEEGISPKTVPLEPLSSVQEADVSHGRIDSSLAPSANECPEKIQWEGKDVVERDNKVLHPEGSSSESG